MLGQEQDAEDFDMHVALSPECNQPSLKPEPEEKKQFYHFTVGDTLIILEPCIQALLYMYTQTAHIHMFYHTDDRGFK